MTRQTSVGLVLAALLALASSARAEEATDEGPSAEERARELNAQAEVHYNLGHFEEALRDYEAAYELFPVAGFLFNLGQCHRQLGHHERAVFFFEGYLRGSPDAPNRALVEELIGESRAALEREEAARRAELEEERRRAEEEERRRAEEEERRRAEEERRRAEEAAAAAGSEPTPVWRSWWLWTIVGVVVAGAVAGGVGYWAATLEPERVLPSGSLGTVDRR